MKKLFSIVLLFCNLTSLAQISDSLNKTNTNLKMAVVKERSQKKEKKLKR